MLLASQTLLCGIPRAYGYSGSNLATLLMMPGLMIASVCYLALQAGS